MPTVELLTGNLWFPSIDCPAGSSVQVENWGGGAAGSAFTGGNFGAAGAAGSYALTPNYIITPNDVAYGVPYTLGSGSVGTAGTNPLGGGSTIWAAANQLNLLTNSANIGATSGSGGVTSNGLNTNYVYGTAENGTQSVIFHMFGTATAGSWSFVKPVLSIGAGTYTGSTQVRIISGSTANISSVSFNLDYFTAGYANYLGTLYNLPLIFGPALTNVAASGITSATTAAANLLLYFTSTAGPVDLAIEIAGLQFEQGATQSYWKSTPGATVANGGAPPNGTTGGVGSTTGCISGPNGYTNPGGNGASYNAAGAGGGGSGGPYGAGSNGTTTGVGGNGNGSYSGIGGAVSSTNPGNPGTSSIGLGGGGGGALISVTGSGGVGAQPGGGGGAADNGGVGGNGGLGASQITYNSVTWPYSTQRMAAPFMAS